MINILYIEENTNDQIIFTDHLADCKIEYELTHCASLESASEVLRMSKFDLIFCSYEFTEGSVIDLLEQHNLIEEIPLVVLSIKGNVKKTRDSLKNGAFDFLSKKDLNTPILDRIITNSLRATKENKLRLDLERRLDSIYANTRTILENTTDGIWSLDDTGKLLIMNSIAKDNIKEHSAKCPAIGEYFFDHISPLFRKIWLPLYEKVLKGEDIVTVDEYLDGDYQFFLEMAITPIISNTETVGVSFVARNVTERELADSKVRESEKNFRSVFTNSEVPIMLVSVSDNKIIDLNNASALLHDFDESQLMGKEIFDVIPQIHHDKFKKDFKNYKAGHLATLDSHILTSKQDIIPVQISVTEIFYKEKQCYLFFLYDISVRVETENKLKQARELAEKSAQFKSLFLANMSHEIRTPMNAMLGFADLLKKTPLNEEQQEYIDIIRNSGNDLLVIINDILDLTKIEAGKLKLRPKHFSLVEMVNRVIKLHKNKAKEKGFGLLLELDTALPDEVYLDDIRLSQVLNNLISNAIKFTEKGEIKLLLKRIGDDESESMMILVRDSGIGIPNVELETIFENFNQVDSSLQRKQSGTGLGLSIVHQLCELMNGSIVARSTVGVGSEFEVILPLNKHEHVEESDNSGVKKQILSDELNILICEDNPINVKLATKILDELGINYRVANNGKEGVEMLRTYTPDAVFMDLQMPEMNGYEATRQIREFSNIPIIAMSAHVMEEEQNKCLEAGMNGFIPKPFQGEDIILALQSQFSFDKKAAAASKTDKWKNLNMPGLTNLSRGDVEFAVSLFDIFMEQANSDHEAFLASLISNNLDVQASIAHRLLPSFMTFNFVQLQIMAEKIEADKASDEERTKFPLYLQMAIAEIAEKRSSFIKSN